MRTRIAPTPSGYLHAGNAVNFLITHELARRHGGWLLLRIDDLDAERSRPEYIDDIFASLTWLEVTWNDGPRNAADFMSSWSQRFRLDRYHDALAALRSADHLYACSCSRTQLPRCTCRDAGYDLEAPGTTWRLKIPDTCSVTVGQWPRGTTTIDLRRAMPDPVLRKRNGDPAYQIASLCDDVDQGIDLVVRGVDLLPSSACQLYLAELLDLGTFIGAGFVHHRLLADNRGNKLSKSAGAASLKSMRESGLDPSVLRAIAGEVLTSLTTTPLG